jgi:hypothetical protein
MSQTNIKQGDFSVPAQEDLTGKEDCLVKLHADQDKLVARLPNAIGDFALFVVLEGAAVNGNASLRPLEPGKTVRLKLKGKCYPGQVVVLADPSVPEDRGKVRQLPMAAGTYRGIAIAQEFGNEGQLILCRPAMLGNITV